jgi:hypothetical protein
MTFARSVALRPASSLCVGPSTAGFRRIREEGETFV